MTLEIVKKTGKKQKRTTGGREIGPRGGPRLHEGEASRWLAFIALRKHSLKTHRTLLWDSDYAPKREGELVLPPVRALTIVPT